MNKTDQLSFLDFEAGREGQTAQPAQAKAKALAPVMSPTMSPSTSPEPSPAPQPDSPARPAAEHEAMAQTLAQHPDFRVLRRLVPHSDYGPVTAQATQRVIVLDTETTGLDSKNEKIIELAMLSVLVDSTTGVPQGPVTLYESFEDPGKPIPAQITEITGIDDSMVQGQRIDDAAVIALVEQADLIVAHNAGFDRPFVEARFPVFAGKAWACSFMG
ncbi:exonuclease domain-containing protein, partial [Limnohabitans sp.]|uniref:exonuclease domain-containing protein n=1 Tax=Limnohabitans sp. TaxID=1907725 RepID=UPI0037C14F2C